MKNKRIFFDFIFIIFTGVVLVVLNEIGLSETPIYFLLIPLLVAYYIGRFVERKAVKKINRDRE